MCKTFFLFCCVVFVRGNRTYSSVRDFSCGNLPLFSNLGVNEALKNSACSSLSKGTSSVLGPSTQLIAESLCQAGITPLLPVSAIKCSPDYSNASCPVCASGYQYIPGHIPSWGWISGRGGGELVGSCDDCSKLCSQYPKCLSYECSPTERKCSLNDVVQPKLETFRNYALCVKCTTIPECESYNVFATCTYWAVDVPASYCAYEKSLFKVPNDNGYWLQEDLSSPRRCPSGTARYVKKAVLNISSDAAWVVMQVGEARQETLGFSYGKGLDSLRAVQEAFSSDVKAGLRAAGVPLNLYQQAWDPGSGVFPADQCNLAEHRIVRPAGLCDAPAASPSAPASVSIYTGRCALALACVGSARAVRECPAVAGVGVADCLTLNATSFSRAAPRRRPAPAAAWAAAAAAAWLAAGRALASPA